MAEYEVQVTIVNLTTKKTIYDRKAYAYSRSSVVNVLRGMGDQIAIGKESDQTYQETQYNETRLTPPVGIRLSLPEEQ